VWTAAGGSMLIWSVGTCPQVCTVSQPRWPPWTLSICTCSSNRDSVSQTHQRGVAETAVIKASAATSILLLNLKKANLVLSKLTC
jgi:hypothetical protein